MKDIEKEIVLDNPFKNKVFTKLILGAVTLGAIIAGTYVVADQYTVHFRTPIILQSPVQFNERLIKVEVKQEVKEATPEAKTQGATILYSGKVSYYSHSGCLGCGESQTMGNGEAFDENALTLAIPCEDITSGKYKYNTKVKVVNQDNFRQEEAVITDCGGFSKYDRVADLSLGLAEKLQATTDKSEIVIYQ